MVRLYTHNLGRRYCRVYLDEQRDVEFDEDDPRYSESDKQVARILLAIGEADVAVKEFVVNGFEVWGMLVIDEAGISRGKQRPTFSMLSHECVDDGEDVVSHGLDQGLHLYVREETVGD